MSFIKATLLLSSLVSGSALNLIPATQLEQPPANSTYGSLQILDSMLQSGKPLNATTSKLGRDIHISCTDALGQGLLVLSCVDAIHHLDNPTGSGPQTWGPRGTGTFSRPLPRFTMSTDGKCVISPVLSPEKVSAVGTDHDVALGAAGVIQDCITLPNHLGGIARNISGDESLNVAMFRHDPHDVLCGSSIPGPSIEASCYNIVDNMPSDTVSRSFGTAGPGIDVVLPKTFISQDGRCTMSIRIPVGQRDRWEWDKFYKKGITVMAMCIRTGKRGVISGLGNMGKMTMELKPATSIDSTT